jgi:Rrf2 family protein
MRLTARSEYALLALVYLVRQPEDGVVPLETIARAQDIPVKFLEQIFLTLRRARILRSTKGHRGGYQLARAPQEISLAEIVRLLDGALAPTDSVSTYFYDATPVEKEQGLLNVFKEIRDLVAARMEATTLADVA